MRYEPETLAAVRDVLEKFQEGYTRRDPGQIDDFMQLFVPDEDLEVIGTGASQVDKDEWCLGQAMAREMVESDWRYWGDVRIDVAGAHIHSMGDVAWLAAPATVAMHLDVQESYKDYIDYVHETTKQEGLSAEQKAMEIMRGVTNTIFELSRGGDFVWPFRFTAVLVRREGRWFFHQMQFSFPTTRYPDVRLLQDNG